MDAIIADHTRQFHLIMEADVLIRLAEYSQKGEVDPRIYDIIAEQLQLWVASVDRIGDQIAQCPSGAVLDEFRECEREARAIVIYDPNKPISEAMERLRDQALKEHAAGEARPMFEDEEE